MNQIIPFPPRAKPREIDMFEPTVTEADVSDWAVARLVTQAATNTATALLDFNLCLQDFHEGKSADVSNETVTSLVEALRLSILATGCRNQDRPLITALCAWSESTKGDAS